MEALEGGFRQHFEQLVDKLMDSSCFETCPGIAPLLQQLLASKEEITAHYKASMAAADRDKACAAQTVQQAVTMQQTAQQQRDAALQEAENAKYVAEAAVQLLGQAQTTALAAQHVANVVTGEMLQMPADAFAQLSPITLLQLTSLLKLHCTPAERSFVAEALLRCSTEEAAEAVLPAVTVRLLAGRTCVQVGLLRQLYFQHPSITQQLLEAIKDMPTWSFSAVLRLQHFGAACTNFLDVLELIQLAIHLMQEEAAATAETAETAATNIHFPGQPSAAPAHAPRSAPLLLPSSAMKLALPAPLPPAAACDAPAPAAPAPAALSPNSLSTTIIHQACSPSAGTNQDQALPLPAAAAPLCSSVGQYTMASEEGSLAASAPAALASTKPQRTIIQAGLSSNSSSTTDCCISAGGGTPSTPQPITQDSTAVMKTAQEEQCGSDDAAWTIAAAYHSEPASNEEPSPSAASSAALPVGDSTDTERTRPQFNKGAPAALRANNQQSDSRRFGSRVARAFLFGGSKSSTATSSKQATSEGLVLHGEQAAAATAAIGEAAAIESAGCFDDSALIDDSLALGNTGKLDVGQNSSTNPTNPTVSHTPSVAGSHSHTAVEMPRCRPVSPSLGKVAGNVTSRLKGLWGKMHGRLRSKQGSMK